MTYKYNPFAAAYPSSRGPIGKIFLPVIDLHTYLRGAHMLLMFPLGIAYFVFFVTTLSVGGSMIWTLIGPIVLLATLFISRWLGDLEAMIAGYVNDSTIRRPPFRLEGVSGFRSQVKVRLVDPTTWTGVVYLIVQFPVGIAAFVGLVTIYAIAVASIISPVVSWLVTESTLWGFGLEVRTFWLWQIDLNSFPGSLVPIPVGILGLILGAHIILAFSSLHGWWARMMLGSRSQRVSSRPAPTPEGDDPPRPSATASIADAEAATVAYAEVKEDSDNIASSSEDESEEPPLESPKTAARIASRDASTVGQGAGETNSDQVPFLKPVPDPVEIQQDLDSGPDLTPIADLTAREQEVFMLMAHGDTNADIAEELFISEGTVKTHVKRVLSKLYMRDRTQVVVFAYEKGLVVPGYAGERSANVRTLGYGG